MSSDEDGYLFSVSRAIKQKQPLFEIKVHNTPVTVMANSGASINVVDETDYRRLPDSPKLEQTNLKFYAYQSDKPLHILGKFSSTIESKTKIVEDRLYVVKGSGGSLLSWNT